MLALPAEADIFISNHYENRRQVATMSLLAYP